MRNRLIGTTTNSLDFCLEVVQGHVNHCGVIISKTTWARDFHSPISNHTLLDSSKMNGKKLE